MSIQERWYGTRLVSPFLFLSHEVYFRILAIISRVRTLYCAVYSWRWYIRSIGTKSLRVSIYSYLYVLLFYNWTRNTILAAKAANKLKYNDAKRPNGREGGSKRRCSIEFHRSVSHLSTALSKVEEKVHSTMYVKKKNTRCNFTFRIRISRLSSSIVLHYIVRIAYTTIKMI